jgi:secreted trypsin-like serine protease
MACRAGAGAVLVGVLVTIAGCAGEGADETGSSEQAIVGGESSEPGEYPATGALVRGRAYRCTATLIAPDVAITAAHCLLDEGWGDFAFTLDPDVSDGFVESVPVLVHHQHPFFHADGEEYTKIGKRNDIAVVILERPIEGVPVERLDDRTYAADLQQGDVELALVGYGREEWSTSSSAGVKRDAVVFMDRATAWELQSIDEDPQPCRGDSGGPLFVETPEGRRITGLVSRASGGSRMCDTGAIYTRVASYLDWIAWASTDRDTGCGVGSGRGGGWWWIAGAAWLVIVLGRRRRGRA